MKPQNPFPSITGALLLGAALASLADAPRASAQALGYATQVLDYTAGTGVGTYTNSASALGKPGGNVGSGTLNPFSPNYAGSELTGIGMSGQLTLQLSNFVTVGAAGTREIGFYGNVGLINTGTTGAPAAGNPATVFGLRSVLVSVSADGINYVAVNGGAAITSTLPANYYTNADTTNVNAPPPANPTLADFGQPFMGSLADFNGESYAQTLTTLNGSAGGTWLDLSATGLSQVGFIRFSEPATGGANGGVFYLNGVSSNEALLGSGVPEPGTWALLAVALAGGAGLLARSRRGKLVAWAGVVLAGAAFLPSTGRAQLLGSLTEGSPSLPNTYYLTVQFANGHYYDFTLYTSVASFNGTDFINTVAAGSQGTSLVLTLDQELYGGTSTYLNGASVNTDTNSGFENNGYWAYWNGSASDPVQWSFSQVGEDTRDPSLTTGMADGWVFGNDADGTMPPTAVSFAVPEPSTWALAALGLAVGGGLAIRRRERFVA